MGVLLRLITKGILMQLTPLKQWIDNNYRAYPDVSEHERKAATAEDFECGISTMYRWLKDGNVYVEDVGASIAGDDSGVIIWEMKKSLFG